MTAFELLEALEQVGDKHVEAAWGADKSAKAPVLRRAAAIAALVAAVLALCGFTAYELGLLDGWLQKPSRNPVENVRTAIENQMEKTYTLDVHVEEIEIDKDETARVLAMYTGSELAKARGWTDEYLSEHFIVVWAVYYVQYDHTKAFLPDGYTRQYFYLTQDEKTGRWAIVDNTCPDTD